MFGINRSRLKGYLIGLAISEGMVVVSSLIDYSKERKIRKAKEKELENLKREEEKGIIDVENYVIYPA